MNKYGKKLIAAVLSLTMTVSLLPVTAPVEAGAATVTDNLVLHYDMSHADGTLTDVTGNGHNAALVGMTDSDFSVDDAGNVLKFDGTSGKYVEIPAGTITGETFTMEAVFEDSTTSSAWLLTLGTTAGAWPNVNNYLFVSPLSSDSSYASGMLGAIKNSSTEQRIANSPLLKPDKTAKNIVDVVFDNGNVTWYLNGVASTTVASGYKIQELLSANSTGTAIGYIGKSLYTADAAYKGTVSDFKIYSSALSTTQITQNYYAALGNIVISGLLDKLLNENTDADIITKNLSFPSEVNGVSLSYNSSDTTVIGNDGTYLYTGTDPKSVTVTVTGTYNNETIFTKDYTLTIVNPLYADRDALTLPDTDQVKGNITLPATGVNGSAITWKSSNQAVISDEAVQNDGYDATPAGVVTRQDNDTVVELTATLSYGGSTVTKTFELTVKAKAELAETTDYIFAYFTGNSTGQEQIYFASSQDGINWEELNEEQPVLESTLGTTGLRDPYILRSAEGDKFYLIATDLCIAKDSNWTTAQTAGSQAIMVWESTDLVHWSDQRMMTISAGIGAGCTWAPEAYYDEQTGEYIVFWASKVSGDSYAKQRIYYCKTRDFYTFSEPQVWIDRSVSTIDTTVVAGDDGYLYRFSKNEGSGTVDGESVTGSTIFLQRSQTMLGTWSNVSSTTLKAQSGVEGPTCFQFNSDDSATNKWCLLLDNFGGSGYYPLTTESLSGATFTKISANLPSKPRHGTVMSITTEEYNTLMAAYGDVTVSDVSVPEQIVANSGYTLPDTVTVSFAGTSKEVAVTWDAVAENAFNTPGTLTVTGVIPSMDNRTISKTITVLSDKLIYFIDSAVGSWNSSALTSNTYDKVSKLINLRNTAADALYTAGGWGIVGKDTAVKARTSTTDSLYSNGWYALSGKNCEYILPLEAGTYSVTGYFAEYWSVTRPMQFYVQYQNDAGETVTSNVNTVTVSSSVSQTTSTLTFQVAGVANTTEVHVIAAKSTTQDPVIAGLSVEKADVSIESISLASTSVSLTEGQKTQIQASVLPANTTEDKGLTYVSSSTKVATVDGNGLVTALAEGTAVITITSKSAPAVKATFTVTVTGNGETRAKADAAALSLPSTVTANLTLPTSGKNGSTITWTSDNTAAISASGKVTRAAKDVTVTLTATVKYGSYTVTKTFKVKVAADKVLAVTDAFKSTKVTPSSKTLYTGKTGKTTTVKVSYPSGFTTKLKDAGMSVKSVKYSTSKSSVAKVSSSGKITAYKAGKATITTKITLSNGTTKSFTTKITVKKPYMSVKGSTTVKKGSSVIYKATKYGVSGTAKWSVSNQKIATINSKTGKLTAKKAGTVKVTVKVGSVTKTITVKVK